jgi:hypothetical protein
MQIVWQICKFVQEISELRKRGAWKAYSLRWDYADRGLNGRLVKVGDEGVSSIEKVLQKFVGKDSVGI